MDCILPPPHPTQPKNNRIIKLCFTYEDLPRNIWTQRDWCNLVNLVDSLSEQIRRAIWLWVFKLSIYVLPSKLQCKRFYSGIKCYPYLCDLSYLHVQSQLSKLWDWTQLAAVNEHRVTGDIHITPTCIVHYPTVFGVYTKCSPLIRISWCNKCNCNNLASTGWV